MILFIMYEEIYDLDKTLVPGNIIILNKKSGTDENMFKKVLSNIYYKTPKEIWCLSEFCYESVKYKSKILMTQEEADGRVNERYHRQPKFIIGVTGSYGKTSTCFFLYQILKQMNYKVCMTSSMGYINNKNSDSDTEDFNQLLVKGGLSTNGYVELKKFLHYNYECDFAILEVTSMAIKQKRLRNIKFNAGILTGLCVDHLDMHNSLDEYYELKLSFLDSIDGPKCYNSQILSKIYREVEGIPYNNDKYNVDNIQNIKGIETDYQKTNVLGCMALLDTMGIHVKPDLCLVEPKGRMEYIGKSKLGAEIYIDGAHSFEQVDIMFKTLNINVKDCLVIYGASGKRLKTDLQTAQVLSKFPYVIITDDGPAPYESSEILNKLRRSHFIIIPNRFEAIKKGLTYNVKYIYILGKSSEVSNSIEYKTHTIYYDEEKLVKRLLENIS